MDINWQYNTWSGQLLCILHFAVQFSSHAQTCCIPFNLNSKYGWNKPYAIFLSKKIFPIPRKSLGKSKRARFHIFLFWKIVCSFRVFGKFGLMLHGRDALAQYPTFSWNFFHSSRSSRFQDVCKNPFITLSIQHRTQESFFSLYKFFYWFRLDRIWQQQSKEHIFE